jgi:hypothetical protein
MFSCSSDPVGWKAAANTGNASGVPGTIEVAM